MCCLNLGSVLNICKIFLDFLYSARDFPQNIQNHAKENGTEQKYIAIPSSICHILPTCTYVRSSLALGPSNVQFLLTCSYTVSSQKQDSESTWV